MVICNRYIRYNPVNKLKQLKHQIVDCLQTQKYEV